MITLLASAIATISAAVFCGIAGIDRLVIGVMAIRKAPPEDAYKVVAALAQMQVNPTSDRK